MEKHYCKTERCSCKSCFLYCALALAVLTVGAEWIVARAEFSPFDLAPVNPSYQARPAQPAPDALTSYYKLQSCSGGSINCHINGNQAGL